VPKKPLARKSSPVRRARGAAAARRRRPARAAPRTASAEGQLSFNHAMIYVKDVERALHFYRDLLGFKPIEDFRVEGRPVYARLKAPGGDATIGLHQAGASDSVASDGVRLYFEVRELDDFCRKLQQKNFFITRLPAMMPWGWRHAYLNDPDGHEISLYWAGENRMKKTMQQAIKKAARSGSSAR
jgi:catechol 2,3-dioxygenase-like lactoylglutathione lyase family enzyme